LRLSIVPVESTAAIVLVRGAPGPDVFLLGI